VRILAAIGRRLCGHDQPVVWELKVTTPDGTVMDITTGDLETIWRYGSRSNDGYMDILQMPRVHLWVRPAGWDEPDRTAQLDGTGALPEGMRRPA